MNWFNLDTTTCQRDGICAEVCPGDLIVFQKGEYPKPIDGAERVCIKCGHCVAACPTGSLSLRDTPVEQCPPVQKALYLTQQHCEHFLRSRRTIRLYQNKTIPREDMARLIEMARYAPSGYNSQCVEWLVLDKKDELQRLAGQVIEWMRWAVTEKPAFPLVKPIQNALQRWAKGNNVVYRDAPAVVITHAEKNNLLAPTSCTIALTYLDLAATSMGLGCCWAAYLNEAANEYPPMTELLSVPEGHRCYGAMMVGYPKLTFHRLPTRRPPKIKWCS